MVTSDIKEYLQDLQNKIEDRKLGMFWIMPDRADFKPIKGMRKADIKKHLKEKSQYYKNKHIADIKIYVNANKVDTDDFVMSIKIIIYEISENGEIEKSVHTESWGSCINFYTEDFGEIKFSLKLVETLMKLTNDRILDTDTLNGITYKQLLNKLKKNKIKWDF